MIESTPDPGPSSGWLNRTVLGAGLTSLLGDVCYEMANAALPGFLKSLQLPAAILIGVLEGTADALANFVKLGAGWYSDRLGRRKPLVVFGYALTGISQALYALAAGFWLVFAAKLLGWFGKGVRGPLRNAILADSVAPADRGKAFGLHRAGDTIGAVIGPLLAFALLHYYPPASPTDTATYRLIFALTLIPGIGAALAFGLLIRERRVAVNASRKFGASLRELPATFRRYLVGVGVFGAGDCSDKLLLLAAITLSGGNLELAPLLYAWRNVVQAVVSFPIGWLSDRIGPRRPLLAGYTIGVVTMTGFALAFVHGSATLPVLFGLFTLAGIYLATEEALESVVTADLVPDRTVRGTAYGLLGVVNGFGDLVASLAVGFLLQYVSPVAAFGTAAVVMALGVGTLGWALARKAK